MSRLVALASLLFVGGCGAERVGSGDAVDTRSYRVEHHIEMTGTGAPYDSRSTTVVSGDASTVMTDETGCRLVMIGPTQYAELPDAAGAPAGKRWIRSELDQDTEAAFEAAREPAETAGSDGEVVASLSAVLIAFDSGGPAEYFAELRKDADPQSVGEETIDGVTTTHFRATVDGDRRMRRQLEADGWEAENVDDYLAQSDDPDPVVDVWVDDAGVARRVRETTETAYGRTVTTSNYFDFGHEETIVSPPAAEVLDSDEWRRIQQEHEDDASSSGSGSGTPSCG